MSNQIWASLIIALLVSLTACTMLVNRRAALVNTVHNAVWAGAFTLIGTDLIRFSTSSAAAWLVLIIALIMFNLGSIFAISRSRFVRENESSHAAIFSGALVTRSTLFVLLGVYIVAVATYLYTIANRFGLMTLFTDPASIRSAEGESYLESVPLLARLGLYLGPLLIAILGFSGSINRPLRPALRAILLIVIGASMLLLLQRTNLYMGVLWLVALYISRDFSRVRFLPASSVRSKHVGHQGKWKAVGSIVLAGIVLVGSFQIVGGVLGKTGQQALSTGSVSEPLARSGLTSPFVYYTAGPVAFLQLVDSINFEQPPLRIQGEMRVGDNNPQTWGAATFSPVTKVVPLWKPFDTITPFIDTGVLTNVYSWIEPFFRDFRLGGVAIGMLFLGFGTSWMFAHRFQSVRLYWLQAAFLSTIFLATFTTKINNTLFLAGILFVLGLSAFTEIKRSRKTNGISNHQNGVFRAANSAGRRRIRSARMAEFL